MIEITHDNVDTILPQLTQAFIGDIVDELGDNQERTYRIAINNRDYRLPHALAREILRAGRMPVGLLAALLAHDLEKPRMRRRTRVSPAQQIGAVAM